MPRSADVLTGAAAADEDMHRMEMCVGWIYEFFSRHRLEEAKKGAPACAHAQREHTKTAAHPRRARAC
jgi:hypothetical protein